MSRPPANRTPLWWLRRGVETITVVLFASYCIILLLEVFFRYVLNSSLVWSEETVRFEQFWVVMLAAGLNAYRKSHIRLEGFESVVPPRFKRSVELAGDFVTVACCGLLLWYGTQLTLDSLGTMSPAMQVSMSYVYAAIPAGALLTMLWTILGWFDKEPHKEPEVPVD